MKKKYEFTKKKKKATYFDKFWPSVLTLKKYHIATLYYIKIITYSYLRRTYHHCCLAPPLRYLHHLLPSMCLTYHHFCEPYRYLSKFSYSRVGNNGIWRWWPLSSLPKKEMGLFRRHIRKERAWWWFLSTFFIFTHDPRMHAEEGPAMLLSLTKAMSLTRLKGEDVKEMRWIWRELKFLKIEL